MLGMACSAETDVFQTIAVACHQIYCCHCYILRYVIAKMPWPMHVKLLLLSLLAIQGDLWWEANRTGQPTSDWKLLQTFSTQNPEAFWTAALRELGISFETPPTCLLWDNEDADKARCVPWAAQTLLRVQVQGWV